MRVFGARPEEGIDKCIDRDGKSRYVRCTKQKQQTYRQFQPKQFTSRGAAGICALLNVLAGATCEFSLFAI
jgi:hypothetical protein